MKKGKTLYNESMGDDLNAKEAYIVSGGWLKKIHEKKMLIFA